MELYLRKNVEDYGLKNLLTSFIVYAFLGWSIEMVFHIYKFGELVNRGFLYGPICPIYGFGAVIMILFLKSYRGNYLKIFFRAAILTSVLELTTGYFLFEIFGRRWWNYSHRKYNIGGYVALKFTIYWAFISLLLIEVIDPMLRDKIAVIKSERKTYFIYISYLLLILDLLLSIRNI